MKSNQYVCLVFALYTGSTTANETNTVPLRSLTPLLNQSLKWTRFVLKGSKFGLATTPRTLPGMGSSLSMWTTSAHYHM